MKIDKKAYQEATEKEEVVETSEVEIVTEEVKAKPQKPKRKVPVLLLIFTILTFLLSIFSLVLVSSTISLPVIIYIFGLFMILLWLMVFLLAIVGTMFIILLSEDFRTWNQGWMDFNSQIFESANTIGKSIQFIIPIFVAFGGVIMAICLILSIVGLATSKHPVFIPFVALTAGLIFVFVIISIVSLGINFGPTSLVMF